MHDMKRYTVWLKIDQNKIVSKSKKDHDVEELRLRSEVKIAFLKVIEPRLKAKEFIHIKNDTLLPFIVLDVEPDRREAFVETLRSYDLVETIEAEYKYEKVSSHDK